MLKTARMQTWEGTLTSWIHAIVRAFGNLVVDEVAVVVRLIGIDALLLGLLCRSILCQILHGVKQTPYLTITKIKIRCA
jgi:hypothetical protein